MAKVFISFIHEEGDVAEGVHRFIREILGKQASSFLASDRYQVFAGDQWLEKIKEELAEAEILVLMLSKASVKRPWVNFEAGAAWLANKKIIPVCFGGLDKGKLPKPYSSYQALDLYKQEDQYYLVVSIAKHLGIMTPPPCWIPGLSTSDDGKESDLSKPYRKLNDWLHFGERELARKPRR